MKIRELTLYSSRINEQKEFYTTVLNIPLIDENNHAFSLQIGRSILHFEHRAGATPYHFAFNIHPEMVQQALNWLQKRVDIIPFNNQELIPFDNWNATAMYFRDKDMNIVEFIARRNLRPSDPENEFDGTSFIEISEIGTAGNDIEAIYKVLNSACKLTIYDGNFDRFCAIGDEHGLFITIDTTRKETWFPANDPAISSEFIISIDCHSMDKRFKFENGNMVIM